MYSDVFIGDVVRDSVRNVCELLQKIRNESNGHTLIRHKTGISLHTKLQVVFNAKFASPVESAIHHLIIDHALSAERMGPGGFDSCIEIIVQKIIGGDTVESSLGDNDDSHVQPGGIRAGYPCASDVSWIKETFIDSTGDITKELFSEALMLGGFGGKIAIEKSKSITNIELVSGYTFKRTADQIKLLRIENPRIICVDGFAESVSELNSLFEAAASSKEHIILFLRGMSNEVMHTIKVNNDRGVFSFRPIVVKYDVEGINTLNDIAVVCDADLVSTLKGQTFSNVSLTEAPKVHSILIESEQITILNESTKTNVSIHVHNLIKKREENSVVDVRELLDKRIRSLTPNYVVIRLEDDKDYVVRSQAIDYALRAFKSLVDHGTIDVNGKKTLTATYVGSVNNAKRCVELLNQVGTVVTSLVFRCRLAY